MFSIVIPLYNKEISIKRTLQSVLNQTFKEFEIIVVNDGSTDSSEKIVKSINDNRIKLINQKNKGVSVARNTGIDKSNNKFIVFLDADDTWDKNYLLYMSELILKYDNINIFACGIFHEYNDGTSIKAEYSIDIEENQVGIINDFFKASMKNPILSSSSTIIRKSILENNKFLENVKMGEDLDLWCRLSLNNKIIFLNRYLVKYNRGAENRACNNNLPEIFPFLDKYDKNEILVKEKELNNSIKNFVFKHKIYYLKEMLKNGYISEAREFSNLYKLKSNIPSELKRIKLLLYLPKSFIKFLLKLLKYKNLIK